MMLKNQYSLITKLKMILWLIRTKILCPKARLIRRPFDIRGQKYIDLGQGLTTGVGCRLEAFSTEGEITMRFGRNVQINDYVHISSVRCVTIGDNVLMASHIYISDNSHGSYKGDYNDSSPDIPPILRDYKSDPVVIGDNVWLGEHVVILPGVTIGRGAIIGSNSVVSKDIPANTISVGSPAKPIKVYNNKAKRWQKI